LARQGPTTAQASSPTVSASFGLAEPITVNCSTNCSWRRLIAQGC
jgi:hypothetical protein